MNQSKIAVRYAKALFELAQEKGKLEDVYKDISLISEALKNYPQFGQFLKSPIVRPSQKLSSVSNTFRGSIDDISLNFMSLLIENKREGQIEDIVRRFFEVYRSYKGIKLAMIVTAVPLDNQLKEKFRILLTSIYKSGIELHEQQDSSIIGGFVLRIGDMQYDASVASGLKKMKTALQKENIK